MPNLTGGCLCGEVRYSLAKPMLTLACHCTNCRRQSGAAYSMNVVVQAADVELKGRVQSYSDRGDSGHAVSRNFCPKCGSPIFSGLDAMPGILAFKAGTLDDPDQVKPVAQVYCDSAVSWSSLDDVTAQFPRGAPAEALFGP